MGEKLGRFELMGQIATGGMAEIHIARQAGAAGFEKLVVIKRLLPELASEATVVQMFLNEARIAARLSHPNIIQIFDLGLADASYFIAMEYVPGENLRTLLKACGEKEKRLPLLHCVEVVRQACEGLHYAHTKCDAMGKPLSIVHCDISPQNLLVSFDGVTKVVDFGIARAAATVQDNRPGKVRGKVGYLSPEQCTGQSFDARADIFSLGIVLWELCTGRRLFRRSAPVDSMKAIVSGAIPTPRRVNPEIPEPLEAVILQALKVQPGQRFQTALELGLALERVAREEDLTSGSMQLGVFMRRVFKDRLDLVQRIERAQAGGEALDPAWFRDGPEGTGSASSSSSEWDEAATTGPTHTGRHELVSLAAKGREGTREVSEQFNVIPEEPPRSRGRIWLFVLLLLVAVGAVGWTQREAVRAWFELLWPKPVETKPVEVRGELEVTAVPEGAEVLVGGQLRCQAPCTLKNLALHADLQVSVRAPGYRVEDRTIRLTTESPSANLEFKLLRAPSIGFLRLNTDVPCEVFRGNRKLGVTPLLDVRLPAGKHSLRLVNPKDGSETTLEVSITNGKRTSLTHKLGKGPAPEPPKPDPTEPTIEPEDEGPSPYGTTG